MSGIAAFTQTVTLNNASDTAIVMPGAIQRFRVREDAGKATTRFTVKAPNVGSPAVIFPAGDVWDKERRSGFKNAETVGFIKLLDVASATFQIEGV